MSGPPRRFRRALIVDDEAERRAGMREGLLDHGVTCDEAATVAEAIRMLTSLEYDLVVCDMVLADPPGSDNAAVRGYLVTCFALARPRRGVVVQASTFRPWAHAGSVLTNWRSSEVVDLVYGHAGIPSSGCVDGGCPWSALRSLAAAPPPARAAAVHELLAQPIVAELESGADVGPLLMALEDAAGGAGDWHAAVAAVRHALFPGASDGD